MRVAFVISFLAAIVTSLFTWVPVFVDQAAAHASAATQTSFNRSKADVDPEAVAFLQVAQWDAVEQRSAVFAVEYKNGEWIIPSHWDYPADGGSRVGETAGGVLNVPRGPLVTDDPTRHAELGLLDPLADQLSTDAKEYGKHVTVKDSGGQTVVDVIVGGTVPGTENRYVRDAESDAVYVAAVTIDVSTAFRDWVKTDLLQVEKEDVTRLVVKDYSIDEKQGRVEQRAQSEFVRIEDSSSWSSPQTKDGYEVSDETVSSLMTELTSLRLIGVRPFDSAWMKARGFYFDQQGNIYGNEGELTVQLKNGLFYHCFFGEIALGDDVDKDATLAAADTATASAPGSNRYMAVFVRYRPEDDAEHAELVAAAESARSHNASVDTESARIPVPEVPDVPAAKVLAEKEQARFGKYFYVIADSSFGFLRPDTEKLFVEQGDSATTSLTPKGSEL